MYLKKLTLRGFKSFASATSFTFEPGITCVVGPNGSGKSNVVDCLAWVMGEQGAKSLRGASMEDVIFAGTSARAPLGRAEVQLTIDNSDGALPIDYTEVTISRIKFRNGSSEYAINGTPARLLDVRELLSDSGIGKEMHVIVGQGHLDQILAATPESRRGFVEEAAGVLKHRERKDKALRKLDATQANLHRLTDLITEIRRQLKPLGRQAEVAQRAGQVQADLRDAKARLLADDVYQAYAVLRGSVEEDSDLHARRVEVEQALEQARRDEDEARVAMVGAEDAYRRIQETWFGLSGLNERVRSTVSLARERVRNAESMPVTIPNPARDPQTLLAQAESIAAGEARLRDEIAARAASLEQASARRVEAEAEAQTALDEFEQASKASADRRERAARLTGLSTSLANRIQSAQANVERLNQSLAAARASAIAAQTQVDGFADLELDRADEPQDLEAAYEQAQAHASGAREDLESWTGRVQSLTQTQAGLVSRIEALELAQSGDTDAAGWLMSQPIGRPMLGTIASLIRVEPGYERAVDAALGAVVEAVAVPDFQTGLRAVESLREAGRGRADLVVGASSNSPVDRADVADARWITSVISGDSAVVASLAHLVADTVVVDDLDQAQTVLASQPQLAVVTKQGDRLTSWLVSGGSEVGQSALHLANAVDEAKAKLAVVVEELAAAEQSRREAQERRQAGEARVSQALTALKASDAARLESERRLSTLSQTAALAQAQVASLEQQVSRAEQELARVQSERVDVDRQLSQVTPDADVAVDSARRDQSGDAAKRARSAEMEARLGLRTLEERARAASGQAESLRKAAQAERESRAQAEHRRRAVQAEGDHARTVVRAGQWLTDQVAQLLTRVEVDRDQTTSARSAAQAKAETARSAVRDLGAQLEALVDSAHREELARARQQMRVDALVERAMTEVGLETEALLEQYGPDKPVPTTESDGESGAVVTIPFVREEQLKRLRTAERDLQILGKVNPLALEEYDAMQERHQFLASQLEDLKKTRADLLGIVEDVDARVQEVFAAAYEDVAREFESTFTRLFPGGQGRLVLTEPGQWLTTGIEVEARPAGKKVKRLSLLSGGERSLVAVCFLVALFKARPSPFYILDEVEAALDDTNLGRLLEIYEELRATSQLLIITHQKRTMEIADTLYGVTMGHDGTSTVVSQRLRDQ
ncbi:MAG: chromosome segregation protein SMC [Propionibacteriaceae bacterium]|jgi:chromosome segregation protein|nr:chromosome segregation protein SMC [Propionibacteriaceae bacterium]